MLTNPCKRPSEVIFEILPVLPKKRNQPHWHWRKPGNRTGRELSIDQRQYAEAEGGIAKCCATGEGVREVQGPGRNNCYKRGTSRGASGNCFRNLFRQWQRETKR